MKIFTIGLLVSVMLVGCQPNRPQTEAEKEHERTFQLAVAGAAVIRDAQRDPDSFQVESAYVVKDTDALCYEYRSRNGFGGMNRARAVIDIKGDKIITDEAPGFRKAWNKECANKEGETVTVNSALKYMRRR